MKLSYLLILALIPVLAGCKPETAAPPAKIYFVRGVVEKIPPDQRHATIKHEAIPGYMAAMTMDLTVKNPNELKDISAGDEITFDMVVTDDDDWIQNLRRTGKSIATRTPVWRVVEAELEVGATLPNHTFTSESKRLVSFADFRGRAVAFTFFFTSCPLPEYCPRMNKNFFEARRLLLADTNAPANWQLLSLSFDPSFDTPEILSNYGKFYRGDNADRWLFAVASTNTLASLGPKVDLRFWREGGSISHNLRTVVLDTNEKIFRQFDGNDWTPQQLAEAIRDAAKVPVR
ncbi:MAG: copper-binding protein [Verrucomicrobiota bacterium]